MKKTANKFLTASLAAAVALTGISVVPNTTSKAADTYSAYFACQANGSYVFRNGCNTAPYGLGSEAFENGLFDTEDCKWKKTDGVWEELESNSKAEGSIPAVITDAHNITLSDTEQTYKITCEADPAVGHLDFGDTGETHSEGKDCVAFNTLYVSTTIPEDAVEVTGCTLTLDGTVVNVHDGSDVYFVQADDAGCLQVDVLNAWVPELAANEAYTMPKESIVIELTLKSKKAEEEPTPTPTPTPEPPVATVTAPSVVKNVTAKNSKAKTVVVSWKKVSKADGYVVYRATKKSGKYAEVKTITKASTVKFTNTKLKKGTTYYYKVKAFKKDGSKKVLSAKYSNIAKVKVKK